MHSRKFVGKPLPVTCSSLESSLSSNLHEIRNKPSGKESERKQNVLATINTAILSWTIFHVRFLSLHRQEVN